jgi:hypothetical protein
MLGLLVDSFALLKLVGARDTRLVSVPAGMNEGCQLRVSVASKWR